MQILSARSRPVKSFTCSSTTFFMGYNRPLQKIYNSILSNFPIFLHSVNYLPVFCILWAETNVSITRVLLENYVKYYFPSRNPIAIVVVQNVRIFLFNPSLLCFCILFELHLLHGIICSS